MRRLCLALAMAACSEESGGGPCPGDPVVEPTTASYDDPETLLALEEGESVSLVFGGQGGFHVWHALRARGVRGDVVVTRRLERESDGHVLFDNAPGERLELVSDEDDCRMEYAQPSFVCAADARDQDVWMEASVDDGDEPIGGRVRVHVVCPPLGTDDGAGDDVGAVCRDDPGCD
jgi:hypothetical protein